MEQTFEGKVAVVTGAARGIGRAVALRLARAGADIALADVNLDGAQQWGETLTAATVSDEVRALGRRSIGIESDLSKRSSAEALIAQTAGELGRIDILVNCAGGAFTPIETSFASISPDQDMELPVSCTASTRGGTWGRHSQYLVWRGQRRHTGRLDCSLSGREGRANQLHARSCRRTWAGRHSRQCDRSGNHFYRARRQTRQGAQLGDRLTTGPSGPASVGLRL
jgi:hypothetical protein